MKLAAVILAAGQSKRFGKGNKLLYEIDGTSLVHRVLQAFEEVGLVETLVVLGHEARAISEALVDKNVKTVTNPEFEEGMGSSLAVGTRALEGLNLDGVLVCVGDLPDLKSTHVAMVIERFEEAFAEAIVVPRFQGTRGHPVCFPARCLPELAQLSGDQGARKLIAKEKVVFLEMPDVACIRDMDNL